LSKDDREKLERKFVQQNISLHKNFSDERHSPKKFIKKFTQQKLNLNKDFISSMAKNIQCPKTSFINRKCISQKNSFFIKLQWEKTFIGQKY
jgi:hypothetical protein